MQVRLMLRITGTLIDCSYVGFSRLISELKGRIRHLDVSTNTYDIEFILRELGDKDFYGSIIDRISRFSKYCTASITAYVIIDEEKLIKYLKMKRIKYVKVGSNLRFVVIRDNTLLLHEYNRKAKVLRIRTYSGLKPATDVDISLIMNEFFNYVSSSMLECNREKITDAIMTIAMHVNELFPK